MIKRGLYLVFLPAFIAVVPSLFLSAAHAASPQLLITWQAADSSGPAFYQGKLLPAPNSKVTASVEVFSGGSFINLANRTIYWYLDGNFFDGGVGKKTVTVIAPGYPEIMTLRAEIHDLPGGTLTNSTHIQMMEPRVILVAPYPNKIFSGSTITIHAEPYFFLSAMRNLLAFNWFVNSQAVETKENPEDLTINLPGNMGAGYALAVTLSAQGGSDPLSSARANITLQESN